MTRLCSFTQRRGSSSSLQVAECELRSKMLRDSDMNLLTLAASILKKRLDFSLIKNYLAVIPTQAGIQRVQKELDSCFRRNDESIRHSIH
jgi:hypothetical protein